MFEHSPHCQCEGQDVVSWKRGVHMTKLNIEIRIDELAELDQVVGYIGTLDLDKVSEFNPEITVKFGHDD